MRLGTSIPALTVALAIVAGSVAANPPLSENEVVFKRLFNVAVANEIRDRCPTISARLVRALLYLNSINSYAQSLGYSKTEIKTFVDSKEQQDRMRVIGYAYLEENGVDRDDPQSYCTFGKTEIARNGAIGRLLKSR